MKTKLIEMQEKAYSDYASKQLWKAIFGDDLKGIDFWSKQYFGEIKETITDIFKPRNADLLENPMFKLLMEMVAEGKQFTPEYKELYKKYDGSR